MEIERGTADFAQEAAFNNNDVRTIVRHLMSYPRDVRLFRLAYEALFSGAPAARTVLEIRLGGPKADQDEVDAAVEIAEAGSRIYATGEAEAGLRRGALLERLVYSLVDRRQPGKAYRETQVVLTVNTYSGKARTGRKDVVVDDAPFEVYECKYSGAIEQWELDELGDMFLTAQAESTDARPCIATMGTMTQLQSRFLNYELEPHPRLYFAGLTDLPSLVERPPSQQVA
jgi:hypothetical protein